MAIAAVAPTDEARTVLKRVALTKIRIYCGCKFHTDSIAEAESHATSTGHTLEVRGEIRSSF